MCGIVGRIVPQGKSPGLSSEYKNKALESLRHRGPDTQGDFQSESVWFGHLRLSILDLSAGANQPMLTPDKRYVICYNGEVYNHDELARTLNLAGLRTHSDTEVVLGAFAKLGSRAIKRLNGMFAFAVFDSKDKKVWLVRDRLGIKPLYFRYGRSRMDFASEIKALLALDPIVPECNLSAIHEWLYYGNTLGEKTLYRDIFKLLPGHYLELDLETFTVKTTCYWSPIQFAHRKKFSGSMKECIEKTRSLLESAVKSQLISDVPVGIFLSGGIDSSAITAFASRHYQGKLSTYSVGFDFDKGTSELPYAEKVAQLYGTDHNVLHVSGVRISDVIEKLVDCHDMPFSDPANIPLYLLCSEIDESKKVILQGDGGDELFGGYSRYSTLSFYRGALMLAKLGQLFNRFLPRNAKYYRRQRYIDALCASELAEKMALLLTEDSYLSNPTAIFSSEFLGEIVKSDPFSRYRECQLHFKGEDIVNQMLLVDSMIILPDIFLEKVDRATMASSVEVRVPFLDFDLVDFTMGLSGSQKVRFGQKKWLLKKALRGIVPDNVLDRKKTGFGVPYGEWLRHSLKPFFIEQQRVFRRQHSGVLNDVVIQTLYDEHVTGKRNWSFLLWKVLNFMVWANRSSVRFS